MRSVCVNFRQESEFYGPLSFITGGAYGGDTYLALACLFLYPQEDHLVCTPENEHNHVLVEALRDQGGVTIIETGLQPLDRDDFMLDRADVLRAFPQTSKEQARGSGTWATIRHARKRG